MCEWVSVSGGLMQQVAREKPTCVTIAARDFAVCKRVQVRSKFTPVTIGRSLLDIGRSCMTCLGVRLHARLLLSIDPGLLSAVQTLLSTGRFRCYSTSDVTGDALRLRASMAKEQSCVDMSDLLRDCPRGRCTYQGSTLHPARLYHNPANKRSPWLCDW